MDGSARLMPACTDSIRARSCSRRESSGRATAGNASRARTGSRRARSNISGTPDGRRRRRRAPPSSLYRTGGGDARGPAKPQAAVSLRRGGAAARGGGRGGRLLLLLLRLAVGRDQGGVEHGALLEDLAGQLVGQGGVLAEELLGLLGAVAQPHLAVVEPVALLVDQLVLLPQDEQVALLADPAVVHQLELGGAERRGHPVLDHLDLDLPADWVLALLDVLARADLHADRAVELQRQPAGGRLG